jgi:hypothetical protein
VTGAAVSGPVLMLRFGAVGLRLAGADARHRKDGAGFVHAEWSNEKGDGLSSAGETGVPGPTWRPLAVAAAAVTIMLAGTTWLWAHFATTLFLETIRTGFVACFG